LDKSSAGREATQAALRDAERALGLAHDERRAGGDAAEVAGAEMRAQLAQAADAASERAREVSQLERRLKQAQADARKGGPRSDDVPLANGVSVMGAPIVAVPLRVASEQLSALRAELDATKAAAARSAESSAALLSHARAELEQLQKDVKSGNLDELAVVRYAAMQGRREEEVGRLRAQISKLRGMLFESHAVLKQLSEQDSALKTELASLEAVRTCAQTLNLEYLRNVLVKYLELVYTDAELSEQAALVRVIQTALHFTQSERERVDRAIEAQDSGWWGKSMSLS